MKKYRDENGTVITEAELLDEFRKLTKSGETDAESFETYVRNCLDKNGTLEEVAPSWMINRLQRNVANDLACYEMPYGKCLEILQNYNVFGNWTAYEINNRPVDLDGISEMIQELGLWR